MPGVLPMKVIKVGTSSQSRVAQACDRCRSKKVKCDGIRPRCTQCANVGFECRTSDKLSRRAFPRGYTESLEERVRQLELETRELKDILDEKDDKLDMLSKMHSNQRHTASASRTPSSPLASTPSVSVTSSSTTVAHSSDANASQSPSSESSSLGSTAAASTTTTVRSLPRADAANTDPMDPQDAAGVTAPKEDTFRVQATSLVFGAENSDSYYMGASSGRSFIDIFQRRMQESGKPCLDFHPEAFLHIQGCPPLVEKRPLSTTRAPPRLFSDRCVNVYFQEWSPLFPILHRHSFLHIYDEFTGDADKIRNHHKLAQLYLVFAIAGLSGDQPDLEQVAICEQEWQRSLNAVLMDNTMGTLQCLVLAVLYCTMRADYRRLLYYKGIAVGLSHRLGLHQSQKRFSFGALTIETRKKVFWSLYTLDCFSAAVLGLPRQLKDSDIQTEYPTDADDEYVTEKGFRPSLPGESTRLSTALALFRLSRILASVLEVNYPAAATHELSLQCMRSLEAGLLQWRDALPAHLVVLTFDQEKPSVNVTNNRSPLLSLAFHYIRALIWRPAIGSSLGRRAEPALLAVSDSSKHIVRIAALLEERKMAFAMCLNKADLLIVCGMTLLHHSMGLSQDSEAMADAECLVRSVVQMAGRLKAPGLRDFQRVANMLVSVDEESALAPQASPDLSMSAPLHRASSFGGPSGQKQQQQQKQEHRYFASRHNSISMSEANLSQQQEKLRRMTMPTGTSPALGLLAGDTGMELDFPSRARSFCDTPRDDMQPLAMSQSQLLGRTSSAYQQQQRRLSQKKAKLDYVAQPASPLQSRRRLSSQQQKRPQSLMEPAQKPAKTVSPSYVSPADWEALLSSMDVGQMNVYDAIYGGPDIGLASSTAPTATTAASTATTATSTTSREGDGWSPEASWDMSGFAMPDSVGSAGLGKGGQRNNIPAPAQSVLSFSDESLGSAAGDNEMAPRDLASLRLGSLDLGSMSYRMVDSGHPAPEPFADSQMESRYAI